MCAPYKQVLPRAHPSSHLQPKRHLDLFSHFTQLTAECLRALFFPLKIATLHVGSGSHPIHALLGVFESITKAASRSVQPFCTAHGRALSEMSRHASNCPFPRGSERTSNTWFLWSTRLSIPNGILIGSAVYAQLTADSPYTHPLAAAISR